MLLSAINGNVEVRLSTNFFLSYSDEIPVSRMIQALIVLTDWLDDIQDTSGCGGGNSMNMFLIGVVVACKLSSIERTNSAIDDAGMQQPVIRYCDANFLGRENIT